MEGSLIWCFRGTGNVPYGHSETLGGPGRQGGQGEARWVGRQGKGEGGSREDATSAAPHA